MGGVRELFPHPHPEAGRAEMSLHVLAYNMKRVIAIRGVGPLVAAIHA